MLALLAGLKERDEGGHTPQGALPALSALHAAAALRGCLQSEVGMGEVPELPWEQESGT